MFRSRSPAPPSSIQSPDDASQWWIRSRARSSPQPGRGRWRARAVAHRSTRPVCAQCEVGRWLGAQKQNQPVWNNRTVSHRPAYRLPTELLPSCSPPALRRQKRLEGFVPLCLRGLTPFLFHHEGTKAPRRGGGRLRRRPPLPAYGATQVHTLFRVSRRSTKGSFTARSLIDTGSPSTVVRNSTAYDPSPLPS